MIADFGQDFYAAQTWSDDHQDDKVWIGWLGNWRYPYGAPTGSWHGAMSLPRTLSLETRAGRPRVVQRVIDTAPLRRKSASVPDFEVDGLHELPFHHTAYELEATIEWDHARRGGGAADAWRPRLRQRGLRCPQRDRVRRQVDVGLARRRRPGRQRRRLRPAQRSRRRPRHDAAPHPRDRRQVVDRGVLRRRPTRGVAWSCSPTRATTASRGRRPADVPPCATAASPSSRPSGAEAVAPT